MGCAAHVCYDDELRSENERGGGKLWSWLQAGSDAAFLVSRLDSALLTE